MMDTATRFCYWTIKGNLGCCARTHFCCRCAQDGNLIGNLEYVTDLMAIKEAHVFKYADRPNLYFDCQILIRVKEPDSACVREQCAPAPVRGKRSASVNDGVVGSVRVRAGVFNITENDEYIHNMGASELTEHCLNMHHVIAAHSR
jgi:hypothetical protein